MDWTYLGVIKGILIIFKESRISIIKKTKYRVNK